jgi:hypothetical protein
MLCAERERKKYYTIHMMIDEEVKLHKWSLKNIKFLAFFSLHSSLDEKMYSMLSVKTTDQHESSIQKKNEK